MAIEHPIPVDVLRQLLRLDPDTGRLYWLPRGGDAHRSAHRAAAFNARFAGAEAFTCRSGSGYRHGRILGMKSRPPEPTTLLFVSGTASLSG